MKPIEALGKHYQENIKRKDCENCVHLQGHGQGYRQCDKEECEFKARGDKSD